MWPCLCITCFKRNEIIKMYKNSSYSNSWEKLSNKTEYKFNQKFDNILKDIKKLQNQKVSYLM